MSLSKMFKSSAPKNATTKLYPEILTHPNIPKPLHLVNPRSILGENWWEATKEKAKALAKNHCQACGVHQSLARPKWLEAHEEYKFDYPKGIITYLQTIAICHYCHNFIHSGRLQMIIGTEKTEEDVIQILEHGFKILKNNNLQSFPPTLKLAKALGARTFGVKAYSLPQIEVEWEEWRMVVDGVAYPPKLRTYEEWANHFKVPMNTIQAELDSTIDFAIDEF